MTQVNGTVENKNNNFDKLNILVNGTWYNTKLEWFKGTQPEIGDVVEFDDGGSKYIKKFKIKGKDSSATAPSSGGGGSAPRATGSRSYRANGEEGGFPIHPMAYERALDRRNALQCAVQVLGSKATPDDIIELARMFEDYTTGTADAEEAKRMVETELSTHAPAKGGWD